MSIYDEFHSLVSSRPNRTSRGFVNINCPSCDDRRKRFGFASTNTGGFRAFCFNGGCEYNERPTGWEPGNGFGGRAKALYLALGGDLKRIPISETLKTLDPSKPQQARVELATKFPEVDLPKNADLIENAAEYSPDAKDALDYLNSRTPLLAQTDFPFMWSPRHKRYLLVPYVHYDAKVVGYVGRAIDATNKNRFIQRSAPDYMFGQHLIRSTPGEHLMVVESPMDAILLRGVASRENRLTKKQINLLKISPRKPILIPDIKGSEAEPYLMAAEENDWAVSVPDWPKSWRIKDPGDAIKKVGLLYTIQMIMAAKTTNYAAARILLGTKTNNA